MKSNPQLEVHPDAESLNAFAEQALSKHERELMLEHLGGCGRCRQVVYLAQEAALAPAMNEAAEFRPEMNHAAAFGNAAAMAPALAVPRARGSDEDKTHVQRARGWFWGWHLAWVPVAALTAIVGVAVFVRVERVEPGFESDKKPLVVLRQSAPQQVAKNAEPLPPAKGAAGNVKPAAGPGTPKPAALKASSAAERAPEGMRRAEAAAPAPPAIQADGNRRLASERNGSGMEAEARKQSFAAQTNAELSKQSAPAPAELTPQPALSARRFDEKSASETADKTHGMAGAYEASRGAQAVAVARAAELKSESSGSFEVSVQGLSAAKNAGTRKAKMMVLPSGLRPISTVSRRDYTLAIDMSGELFLSQDSGGHWEPVARQWSGRAVAVRIQGGLKLSGAAAAGTFGAGSAEDRAANRGRSNDSNLDGAAFPGTIFEIVNDRDEVWISVDGKSWTAK